MKFTIWICGIIAAFMVSDCLGQNAGAPQQASNLFNPNISAIVNLLSGFGNSSDLPEGAFALDEVELGIQSVVDPYFRADAFIGYHGEEVEVEEAYLTWLTMPGGLQAKIGKFRAGLGKFNPIHPPETGLADRPLSSLNFFGEEGLGSAGVSVSWLVPLDVFLKLTAEVTTIWEGAAAFGTIDTTTAELVFSEKREDLGYLGRAETFFDLSEASNIALGGTVACAINGPDEDLWTHLFGGDLTFRWKNPRRAVYHSVTWRNEFLYNRRQMPSGMSDVGTVGFFSILDWQFSKRWHIGGRYDYSEFPDLEGPNEKGGLAYLTFTRRHR
jgi:hypothetical protein